MEATNYRQEVRCGTKSGHSIANMRWSECGGGLCILKEESNETVGGRESMIVSYASYIRVPAGSMAGLLQQQQQESPNHLVCERTAAVSSLSAVQPHVPESLSSLLSFTRVLQCMHWPRD